MSLSHHLQRWNQLLSSHQDQFKFSLICLVEASGACLLILELAGARLICSCKSVAEKLPDLLQECVKPECVRTESIHHV